MPPTNLYLKYLKVTHGPPKLRTLVQRCTHPDPVSRPTYASGAVWASAGPNRVCSDCTSRSWGFVVRIVAGSPTFGRCSRKPCPAQYQAWLPHPVAPCPPRSLLAGSSLCLQSAATASWRNSEVRAEQCGDVLTQRPLSSATLLTLTFYFTVCSAPHCPHTDGWAVASDDRAAGHKAVPTRLGLCLPALLSDTMDKMEVCARLQPCARDVLAARRRARLMLCVCLLLPVPGPLPPNAGTWREVCQEQGCCADAKR